jgi:hypothetical protein
VPVLDEWQSRLKESIFVGQKGGDLSLSQDRPLDYHKYENEPGDNAIELNEEIDWVNSRQDLLGRLGRKCLRRSIIRNIIKRFVRGKRGGGKK